MNTFLMATIGNTRERGDAVRTWMKEGRRLAWPCNPSPNGSTMTIWFDDPGGRCHVELDAEELAVCIDYALSIGHPDAHGLAWLLVVWNMPAAADVPPT